MKTSNLGNVPAESYRKRKLVEDVIPSLERPKKERKVQNKSADHYNLYNQAIPLRSQPPALEQLPDANTTVLNLPTPQQQYQMNNSSPMRNLVYLNERQYIEDNTAAMTPQWNASQGSLSGSDGGYWSQAPLTTPPSQYYPQVRYYKTPEYMVDENLGPVIQDTYEYPGDAQQLLQTAECKTQAWSSAETSPQSQAVKTETSYYNQNRTIAENYALQALLSLKDLQMVYT